MSTDKSAAPALLPCPFCGSAPNHGFMGDEDGGYHYVDCPKCNGGAGVPFIGVHEFSHAVCAKLWNCRASPAADALEALRHIAHAAMDITVERQAIAKAARDAIDRIASPPADARDADARDTARYRWLRSLGEEGPYFRYRDPRGDWHTGSDFDACVDAAMSAAPSSASAAPADGSAG